MFEESTRDNKSKLTTPDESCNNTPYVQPRSLCVASKLESPAPQPNSWTLFFLGFPSKISGLQRVGWSWFDSSKWSDWMLPPSGQPNIFQRGSVTVGIPSTPPGEKESSDQAIDRTPARSRSLTQLPTLMWKKFLSTVDDYGAITEPMHAGPPPAHTHTHTRTEVAVIRGSLKSRSKTHTLLRANFLPSRLCSTQFQQSWETNKILLWCFDVRFVNNCAGRPFSCAFQRHFYPWILWEFFFLWNK